MGSLSVIIPTHNSQLFVGDCLRSVYEQTCEPYEVIVVDDGSTDSTVQLINAQFPRTRLLTCSHAGAAAARNVGIVAARGTYVAFLDSDDLSVPHRFERQVAAFETHPGAGFVFGPAAFIDAEGEALPGEHGFPDFSAGTFLGRMIVRNRIASTSCVTARLDLLREAGGFDERLVSNEEYDLWLRLLSRRPCMYTPETVVHYRRHAGNVSQDCRLQAKNEMHAVEKLPAALRARELARSYPGPLALKAHARVCLKMDRPVEAQRYVKDYLEIQGQDAGAWFLLGNCQLALGFLSEAEHAYRNSQKTYPDCAALKNNLGVLLYRKGKVEAAASLFADAHAMRPQYGDAAENVRLCADQAPRDALRVTMRLLRRQLVPVVRQPEFPAKQGDAA
jgi:glycosyltransferase involved in cell wall biosynthesis